MLSDNGKTFQAAAKDIKWIFNVPKAPWWGGVFERMVRSIKRCLKKIIGKAKFTQDELLTAITEVEMVINSRPLSYVSASDVEEPLTPSHLIVGRRLMNVPEYPGQYPDNFEMASPDVLTRQARHLNSTIDKFWERWRKEYLVELRAAHKQKGKGSSASRVSVGDVVVIHSDNQPRGMWDLGLVEELLIGSNGEARGAVLRVAGPGRRAKHLMRPVQRLYPIEMPAQEKSAENSSSHNNPTDEPDNDTLDVSTNSQESPASVITDTPSPKLRRSSRVAAADA